MSFYFITDTDGHNKYNVFKKIYIVKLKVKLKIGKKELI